MLSDDRFDTWQALAIDPLLKERMMFKPPIPAHLEDAAKLICRRTHRVAKKEVKVEDAFSHLIDQEALEAVLNQEGSVLQTSRALRVGILLSGGPAPGGHNVIAGLFDALLQIHPESQLIGFLEGFQGFLEDRYLVITSKRLAYYRNMGGFDLLGSGRLRIQTPEQFAGCKKHALAHRLDGLVIVGGDDSHTNAAMLAEEFAKSALQCSVIGVPKTIDNDLTGNGVELSFGHDSACSLQSAHIGDCTRLRLF